VAQDGHALDLLEYDQGWPCLSFVPRVPRTLLDGLLTLSVTPPSAAEFITSVTAVKGGTVRVQHFTDIKLVLACCDVQG
jgi:hypothetical protein